MVKFGIKQYINALFIFRFSLLILTKDTNTTLVGTRKAILKEMKLGL
jgi:hypothetical protein